MGGPKRSQPETLPGSIHTTGSGRGASADVVADVRSLLTLADSAPLPAAAIAYAAVHDMLEAHVQAVDKADTSGEMASTMAALAPAFGWTLRRPGVLPLITTPPAHGPLHRPAAPAPGSLAQMEWATAATTLLIVQQIVRRTPALPQEEEEKAVLRLLQTLRHAAPICLRLAACQAEDTPSEQTAANIYCAARLAFAAAAADRKDKLLLNAQRPLLQLAQRCRAGVDADVADMQQRAVDAIDGGQAPPPGDETSIWARPLGAVMQALGACAMTSHHRRHPRKAMRDIEAAMTAGSVSLPAHEAVPLGVRGEADFDMAHGICAALHFSSRIDCNAVQQVLDRLGRAVQGVCEQLPDERSRQDPSRAAACAAARLSDLAGCGLRRARNMLPDSLLAEPLVLRQFGFGIATSMRRVLALLDRDGQPMPPPVERSLFLSAHYLGLAAVTMVQLAAGAGVAALERPPVTLALENIATLDHCPRPVLQNFWRAAAAEHDANPKNSEHQVMRQFRDCAKVVTEAAETLLATPPAQHPGREPAALIDTLCRSAAAYFGLARIESWYLLAGRKPAEHPDRRLDLDMLQRGALLTIQLCTVYDRLAQQYLGGMNAYGLISAMEAVVLPGLPPPTMQVIYAACVALDAALRVGAQWEFWSPELDTWQYMRRAWPAFAQRLARIAQDPAIGAGETLSRSRLQEEAAQRRGGTGTSRVLAS